MNHKMSKISIIGGPGSGKSYAARRLSQLLKIPYFDLDELKWSRKANRYGIRAPENIRDKKLNNILKKDKWIIEGVYYDWVHDGFIKADRIIVLKSNVYLRDCRIIKRFISRKLRLVRSKKENLRDLFKLLKWNHQFDSDYLVKIELCIKKFRKKTRYFNKADDAIDYILKMIKRK